MRFLSIPWIWKPSCFLLSYLTCLSYSEASLVMFIAFSCLWTKLCLCAKTSSIFVSNPKHTFSGRLPMCSSRGRLWISWGYVHDLRVMLQLAIALLVCRFSCFRQRFKFWPVLCWILILLENWFWVKSYPCWSLYMCCILHVFTNVGQVVKNLFPETISLSIAV